MREYLLFIDTEASCLPKKWDVPYSVDKNWPHMVQLSWIVYTKEGDEVKREDHFNGNDDFKISSSAEDIHGITRAFLNENGESRKEILSLLETDVIHYQPLVVAHFMELDFHLVGADAYRTGMENPLSLFPTFCTMLATTHLVQNPAKKYFSLCQLHDHLFSLPLTKHHNAIEDAQATARIFFELLRRGEINDEKIENQQKFLKGPQDEPERRGCSFILALGIVLLGILIITL